MKTKSNRRGRRQRGYRGLLWVLAAGLLLFGLIAQQNILLGTSSQHALLMDARTGQVLARKRSGEEAAPASLTKMMTVLLATEALPDLDTPVTLPEDIFPALYKADASMAGFQPGETVTVRDLLYGAMLPSGAECCEALARQVSGSEEAFVALMNRKAGELGMKHTHFANCTGLTSPEHYSSAADLAVLLQAALNNETFRTVFTTGQYTSSVTAQHPKGLYMASTLLSRLDGGEVTGGQILGGKTGYTDAAGLCLASLAVVNGKEYILVTLGAPGNHATEQTNIMDAVQVYRRLEKKKSLFCANSTASRLCGDVRSGTMEPQTELLAHKEDKTMYELNKIAFGSFLAQLRREKGMTQKELAACLYVSDKAVSKWERGLSVPDISLLVPLAEQLNVTVAELLQGCRVEEEQRFTREETEELIRKALTFSATGSMCSKQCGCGAWQVCS